MEPAINMDRAQRIAFADTKHLGRPRWSELSVFYLHEPQDGGKRWLALSVGMSSKSGEVPLTDSLCTFSLERALDLFDESQIGRQVKAQARDWAEHNAPDDNAGDGEPVSLHRPQGDPFTGSTDEEALLWLFGPGYSERAAARAFDMGASTLRMALRNSTPVRIPLVQAMRYFDRERFLADLRSQADAA